MLHQRRCAKNLVVLSNMCGYLDIKGGKGNGVWSDYRNGNWIDWGVKYKKTCLIFFVVSLALLERIEMCVIFERQRNSIFFFLLLFSLSIFILLSNLCIASLCGLILCVYTSYDAKTLILWFRYCKTGSSAKCFHCATTMIQWCLGILMTLKGLKKAFAFK